MTEPEGDERILDRFRTWLQEMREAAARDDEGANGVASPVPRFGLDRLVEEFTALRHELKLQTRSSRALEERVEASIPLLTDAATTFRTSMPLLADAATTFRTAAAQQLTAGTETADKNFATILAELDEALERGREQWKKNSGRLTGTASSNSVAQLNEFYAGLTWWQRRYTAAYHKRICQHIEQAETQARGERQALLTALLSGYDLIQQRLMRTMVKAGVVRIPTVGRLVDPEQMVVVEVVDAPGQPGQVIEEIRRGYTWKGGLLRPAEVRAIRPRFEANDLSPQSPLAEGSEGEVE